MFLFLFQNALGQQFSPFLPMSSSAANYMTLTSQMLHGAVPLGTGGGASMMSKNADSSSN